MVFVWQVIIDVCLLPSCLQGEILGVRLDEEAMNDDSEWHQAQFLFDDGGMRGLAAALVWCGIVYFLPEQPEGCSESIAALAKSLLEVPAFFKHQPGDPGRAMIGRIIRQNVESKKLPVSELRMESDPVLSEKQFLC